MTDIDKAVVVSRKQITDELEAFLSKVVLLVNRHGSMDSLQVVYDALARSNTEFDRELARINTK